MKLNLKERLEKADKRIKALQENAEAREKNRELPHPKAEKAGKPGLKEMEAYKTFLMQIGKEQDAPSTNAMANLKEMLTSTDLIQNMVPKIIVGKMIEAQEPELLFSNLFTHVNAPGAGVSIIVPIIGEIFVREVGEGEPFNESSFDISTMESNRLTIDIKKVGIKVSITEEALSDYTWDIYNITLNKIGRAFARFKEQKCFKEASKHGHTVFNNAIRQQKPEAGTTGCGADGKPNDTFSMEDMLNMMLAGLTNHHTMTDFFAHPYIWTVFARNAMVGPGGSWGALNGQNVNPGGGTQGSPNFAGLQNNMGPQKFIMTPDQVQNRLPFGLTVNLTPQVKFDKKTKLFDCYLVDRNSVGVIAQRQDITMDNWKNPERDIQFVKAKERYGVGIQDHGLGIMVARNIAAKPTYPKSLPVHVIAD